MTICLFQALVIVGQSESRNVVKSDISEIYRNAVKKSYYKILNRDYSLVQGYLGMIDFGYTAGLGEYDFGRVDINTSHGYQYNPFFYLGGGLGVHVMSEFSSDYYRFRKKQCDIPIYAITRLTLLKGNITPYADGRFGFFVTHGGGLYASISLGCRFAVMSGCALNFSIGYSCENLRFETLVNNANYHSNAYTNSLTARFGYEF